MFQEIDYSKTVILFIVAIPLAYIANGLLLIVKGKWLEYKLEKNKQVVIANRKKILGYMELLVLKGAPQSVLQPIFNRDPELRVLFGKKLADDPVLKSLFKKNNERCVQSLEDGEKS